MALADGHATDILQRDTQLLERESKARAEIAKEASPSVVNITVEQKATPEQTSAQDMPSPFNDEFMRRFFQGQMPVPQENGVTHGLGSGIIVDAKGYVLTNNHVVENADKITVKLSDGRVFPAKRVGTDPATDVAVLKIEGTRLPVAKLGNSDDIDVGESVLAIGNPFGLDRTITSGIISAKGRSQVGIADYENFIQTDASINPGNSGGPLLNLKGEVIGVNTAIIGKAGGNVGIGFAIPINQARTVMNSLVANGKVVRGFLGVEIQELTPELASAMNLTPGQGVLVAKVSGDSPASRADVKQGDVIVSFNNQPMKSVNTLRYAVAGVKPGDSVPTEVLRNGKQVALTVKIQEQPKQMVADNDQGTDNGTDSKDPANHVLGMTLKTLDSDLAARLGDKDARGVLITSVDADGAAARAGLQEGVVVLDVDHHPVHTVQDMKDQVSQAKNKKFILLLVRSSNADRYVAVPTA
jgi:serine protease Do